MLQLEVPGNTHSIQSLVTFSPASVADYVGQRFADSNTHLNVANTSLGYLSMDALMPEDIQILRHKDYRFLDYATSHWARHTAGSKEEPKLYCLLAFARESPLTLFQAASWGLADALHHLLANSISPNRRCGGKSPLSVAAERGQLLCASYLIEAGADVDYAGDRGKILDTALTYATRSVHSQMVLLLIDANADLNAGRIPPIFAAIRNDRLSIVRQLLLAGCDPDVRYKGRSAIISALDRNSMDIAESLMLGGADLNARYGD